MADRKRSQQGGKDSEEFLGPEDTGEIDEEGRSGGRTAREVASVDEEKRSFEKPGGRTRPTRTNELKDTETGGGDA